tara:strand:+ start:628 stop:978 length:351 start_codon:yes stop_codon:yes gene_type:complete
MKKLLFTLLLIIPFIGFGQVINNTVWKTIDDKGDQRIIMFKVDGTFIYQYKYTNGTIQIFGDEDDTWTIDGNKLVLSFNDGFAIMSGEINSRGDYISGFRINKKGTSLRWTGTLID